VTFVASEIKIIFLQCTAANNQRSTRDNRDDLLSVLDSSETKHIDVHTSYMLILTD